MNRLQFQSIIILGFILLNIPLSLFLAELGEPRARWAWTMLGVYQQEAPQ